MGLNLDLEVRVGVARHIWDHICGVGKGKKSDQQPSALMMQKIAECYPDLNPYVDGPRKKGFAGNKQAMDQYWNVRLPSYSCTVASS